ncbi:unnamed protein product [Linum tenue]|uniref:Uncharacterized protein n=1 Tax=Linum tenue TaxID=586396 RepID=A0AAV0RSI0_9ROSI|nr:unnamed protein product [Linum tenue]
MSDHFIAPWDLQEEPSTRGYGPRSPIHDQQNDQLVGNGIPNGGNPFAHNGAAQEDKKSLLNDVISSVVNELNSSDILNEGEHLETDQPNGAVQQGSSGEGPWEGGVSSESSSKNFTELLALASKLRNDPRLTAEQLVKLKLIEEMSSFREVCHESRDIIVQIDRHYGTLEANKAKALLSRASTAS